MCLVLTMGFKNETSEPHKGLVLLKKSHFKQRDFGHLLPREPKGTWKTHLGWEVKRCCIMLILLIFLSPPLLNKCPFNAVLHNYTFQSCFSWFLIYYYYNRPGSHEHSRFIHWNGIRPLSWALSFETLLGFCALLKEGLEMQNCASSWDWWVNHPSILEMLSNIKLCCCIVFQNILTRFQFQLSLFILDVSYGSITQH